LNVCFIYLVI